MDILIFLYLVIGLVMRLTDNRQYHSELHILCSALIWPRDLYRWSKKK